MQYSLNCYCQADCQPCCLKCSWSGKYDEDLACLLKRKNCQRLRFYPYTSNLLGIYESREIKLLLKFVLLNYMTIFLMCLCQLGICQSVVPYRTFLRLRD